ncbi:thioredoxin domain-containing protein [Lysinibacillus sp. KU-BSD001]|uniref:thioredoxin domain-containing protein n=1 Tax=Lysinibacillus sp. KU-BSD001 TaxID=3141328 RepID=UPI0036F1C378
MHLCLEYDNPTLAFEIIDDLFATQDEWTPYNSAELKQLLVTKYDLHEEAIEANTERSLQVILEAIERDMKLVPTIFINGEKHSFKERRVYLEYPTALEKLNA